MATLYFISRSVSSDLWALVKADNPVLTLFGVKDSPELLALERTIASDSRLGSSFPLKLVSVDCKTSTDACHEFDVLFSPSVRLFRYVSIVNVLQQDV